ncbi:MAG: BrnA antitoxin family protein [Ignavibacteria bacterium]|nr:BrnA antitoxin family protein [Ignavibacteria bacterium]
MKKNFKQLPKFKSEDEVREFWDTHDSTEYFDWSKAKVVVFPNLKMTKDIKTSNKKKIKNID